MAKQLLTERAADFGALQTIRAARARLPFSPQILAHVYVKLEFKQRYENAGNADDARGFLRSVARAAMAAHEIGTRYDGVLLEVQGSMLHIAFPRKQGGGQRSELERAHAFVSDLHWTYRTLFPSNHSRVDGWRMAIDVGNTLVVVGQGIHSDDSWVSLGKAANRPAKQIYAQLERAEQNRELKRFHVGVRDPLRDRWQYWNLDNAKQRLEEARSIAEGVRAAEPRLDFVTADSNWGSIMADATPMAPAGTPGSPSPEKPHTYFGWVMRADLDGFTSRVEECFDNNQKLQELAVQFYRIMNAAADFALRHPLKLAQLPWAGDNFTAAAVFPTRDAYGQAATKGVVELSLDFEKEMCEAAVASGFGGWAHGIAGGEVHSSAFGNLYIAGVEVGGRRFLIGVGEGFGRSTQAFSDVNPKAGQMVLYRPDWQQVAFQYKSKFATAISSRGGQSSLFYISMAGDLVGVRARSASTGTTSTVTFPRGQQREVPTKPHY